MKKYKDSGITLIALVITIILLLILAGITVSQLVENGLWKNANKAKSETIKAQIKEELQIELNNIIIDCTIENKQITNEIVKQELEKKLPGIQISENLTGNYKGYDYVIDENFNINFLDDNKENSKVKYLFKEKNKYEDITGGWNVCGDRNTSYNLDDYNYMEINSHNANYCGISVSTGKEVDIANFNKIKVNLTAILNGSHGTGEAYCLGIKKTQFQSLNWEEFDKATEKIVEVGENITLELDVSELSGNYFIGIQTAHFLIKIHEIWVE